MSAFTASVLEELEWRGALPASSRDHVESAVAHGTGLLLALVSAGVAPDEALLVVSQASSVPIAPRRLVDSPAPPPGAERLRPVGGVVIGQKGDVPCVAFDDPDRAIAARRAGGEAFVAVLVLPASLASLAARLTPATGDVRVGPAASRTAVASLDATDPDEAPPRSGASSAGVLPEDDELDDEQAATVVNDVAALAALAAREPVAAASAGTGFSDERTAAISAESPATLVSASARPLAARRALEPSVEDVPSAESSDVVAERDPFGDVETAHGVDDGSGSSLGIDPALLRAVVAEEMGENDAPAVDHDPATLLTEPLTPELEARYGAMKTTALKLHVDASLPASSLIADDESLFSDEDAPVAEPDGLLVDATDASGFESDDVDPLAAQPTVAVPTTGSEIESLHLQAARAAALAAEQTVVTPARVAPPDSTRPTPAPAAPERLSAKPAPPPRHVDEAATEHRPIRRDPSSSSERRASANETRYETKGVLGRGGMATVYLAHDRETGRDVALKILEAHLASDETFIERFRREMRATENLDHPNIIRCFDAGESAGDYFIAAEYVDAGTLSQLLKTLGPMPLPLVVGIMEQALKGLEYAHASGMVHRDLKPANVMFNKQGVLKVGDFGIAKSSTDTTITQTGTLFGTPAYMSPEQATGKDLDARSDLFSIGIVFYQLLTGENPFHFDNPSTSLFRISAGMYPPLFDKRPDVPQVVDDVITKLLARERDERYPNAAAALHDLAPLLRLIRQRHPDVEARVLAEPLRMAKMLREDEASLHVAHGRVFLDAESPRVFEGMFHMFQASRIDPENYEATNALAQYRIDHQIRFDRPDDPRIDELEQAMGIKSGEQKCTPAQLRRAVDLHHPHRDLFGMARYLRRYLRLMPQDAHMQMRFKDICGADPLAPFSPVPKLVQAAPKTDDDVEVIAGLAPKGPIRGKAAPQRGARPADKRPAVVEERAAAPVSTPAASPLLAPSTSDAAAPAPVDEPPPRDSLEALVRAARLFWVETLRSITGDRGVDGLKEWWEDRFGRETRKELTKEAKEILAASKEVLSASQKKLLEEAKKESFREELMAAWARHRRLILIGVGVVVTYSLLSYGCSLLFSEPEQTRGDARTGAEDAPRASPQPSSAPPKSPPNAAPAPAAPEAQRARADDGAPTSE